MQALFAYMEIREVAGRLRAQMDAKGWTQTSVAKATGVHQSQISRFCAGDFARSQKNLRKVCHYADVPLDEPLMNKGNDDLRTLFNQILDRVDPAMHRSLFVALQGVLKLL